MIKITERFAHFEKWFAERYNAEEMTLKSWTDSAKDELGDSYKHAKKDDKKKLKEMLKDLWNDETSEIRDKIPNKNKSDYEKDTEHKTSPSDYKRNLEEAKEREKKKKPRWSEDEKNYLKETMSQPISDVYLKGKKSERLGPTRTLRGTYLRRYKLIRYGR